MELSYGQKVIIKNICNGDINDLHSYVIKLLNMEEIKYVEEDILSEKKQHYLKQVQENNNIKSKLKEKYGEEYDQMVKNRENMYKHYKSFLNYSEEKNEQKIDSYNKINKENFNYELTIQGVNFKYNLLEEDVYIIDDSIKLKIMNFISVWYRLEKEGLIISVPKTIDKRDCKIFFEKKTNQNYWKSNENTSDYIKRYTSIEDEKPKNISEALEQQTKDMFLICDIVNYKNIDLDYSEYKLSIDYEFIKHIDDYIGKRIIVLPELKKFIDRNYITYEDYQYRQSMKLTKTIAVISIIISIITIAHSTYESGKSSKSYEEFWIKQIEKLKE